MIPYVVIVLVIIFARYLIGTKSILLTNRAKRRYLFIALIPVFFVIAFRGETIGMDTSNYIRHFEELRLFKMNYDERIEIGYVYLVKYISSCFDSVRWLFVLTAFFTCLSIGQFIYRTAKDPSLALLFFVTLGLFQFALSGIRQTIAISITLWLYPYIKHQQLLKFTVGIIVASLFHKSAFLFFPAYIMAQQHISTKLIFFELLSFAFIFLVADKLLLLAADTMNYNYGIEETGNGYIFFCIVLLISIFGLINKNDILKQNFDNQYIINVNFISLLLWGIRLISRTAERVSFYYMPYTYLLLEEYLTSQKKVFIYPIIMVLAICLFFYRVARDPSIFPYIFSFN